MRMGVLVDIESILVISLWNLLGQLENNRNNSGIFVICLVVGFEAHEVDSLVMKIVSVLHKPQLYPTMSS